MASTSSEVSWQSAFWSLPPLAINTMTQPTGKVCGLDLSLRTYLRSSPIVCIADATTILIRFTAYIYIGFSPSLAAKRVLIAREHEIEDNGPRRGGFQALEQLPFLRIVWFFIGVLPQVIKLLACTGLPGTQTWGCFYLSSFIVVETMNALSSFAAEEEIDFEEDNPLERSLHICERTFGALAIFSQLCLLAWVDLAGHLPDPGPVTRWSFWMLRLTAHFVVIVIYLSLTLLQAEEGAAAAQALRRGAVVLSMLVIYVVLAILHGLDMRFSHMYFIWSFIISSAAWALFFYPPTRRHLLLCESGHRRGFRNVLAFDFFCRIFCFGLFWYYWYYNPANTKKPDWVNVFG